MFNPQLGTPRDLNGDGDVDQEDHSGDYQLLPVVVRVRWAGSSGFERVELKSMLADLQ